MLFIGIFITMQPALMLLRQVGPNLGLEQPWQLFWSTGALSSFLDNTPTYLVFLTTAGTLGFTSGIATSLGTIPVHLLSAISCGAVFMGANTYIGNAPNFMVKSISDENGVNMPSFFGYMLWSVGILIPVFLLDTLIFFCKEGGRICRKMKRNIWSSQTVSMTWTRKFTTVSALRLEGHSPVTGKYNKESVYVDDDQTGRSPLTERARPDQQYGKDH